MDVPTFFSRENPVFSAYATYATVLVFKMIFVAIYTSVQRKSKNAFANPEDVKISGSKAKVVLNDPDVERVRRAHLNDLENIPAFLFVSFLYILTSPSVFLAVNLFRVYTAARIVHTFVYAVKPMPQPARGLSFGVGLAITVYMGFQVGMHFCTSTH